MDKCPSLSKPRSTESASGAAEEQININDEKNVWNNIPPSLISRSVWLPLHITHESLCSLINHLTLNQCLTVLPVEKALTKKRNYAGFICISSSAIEFDESQAEPIRDDLFPKNIVNSNVTLDLLSIRMCNRTDYPTAMETYMNSLFGSGYTDLVSHVTTSIPIVFAHNQVAIKAFKDLDSLIHEEDDDVQRPFIYSFVALESSSDIGKESPEDQKKVDFLLIDDTGRLLKFSGSATLGSTIVEFRTRLEELGVQDMYAVVENKLQHLRNELEKEKQHLCALNADDSFCQMLTDESFSLKDLNEMSALSEEIDDAEDYELHIEGENLVKGAAKPLNTSKDVREIEKRVRNLVMQIARLREEMSEEMPPNVDHVVDKNIYATKDYLHFSRFYREKVLENPLNTPRSAPRKRISQKLEQVVEEDQENHNPTARSSKKLSDKTPKEKSLLDSSKRRRSAKTLNENTTKMGENVTPRRKRTRTSKE